MKKQFHRIVSQQPLRQGEYYLRGRQWDSAAIYVNYYGEVSAMEYSRKYRGFKRKLVSEYYQQQAEQRRGSS